MPSVAFHIKAQEPEGGTLPSRLDYDDYYDNASDVDFDFHFHNRDADPDSDDDVYYDDDDDDSGSRDDDVYLEEPEEEFEIPLESSSLRRNGSTHIRDLAKPALARHGTLGSVHIEDLAQPAALARYGTLSSVHIEDIMPTPTDYLDRYESAHIDDLMRLQAAHIQDPALEDCRDERGSQTKRTPRSKSKSRSKKNSRSRSKSVSKKPKSGKESKESKPKSRSRSKSNSSRQRQRSRSRPKNKTKESADHRASKSLRKSKKKSKSSSSSSTKSSLHTILSPKKPSSSKPQKLYLSPLEVHNSITNATKPKQPKSKPPPLSDQLYPSKESIATTTSDLAAEPIVDDSNSAFLQEQRELLEKISQNDAKLAAMKAPKKKKSPPVRQQRASRPKRHPPQPRHPQPPIVVDESILNAMEPHERQFFLQEQQQLLEKIKRDRASREADARFAQELAAAQEHQQEEYHQHPQQKCYRSSSFARKDEGTASTCSPGSSFESSSPLWAASVVDPPVLDVHCNPNPSHRRVYY